MIGEFDDPVAALPSRTGLGGRGVTELNSVPSEGSPSEEHEVPTFCRLCSARCGIIVTAIGDEIKKVRGDRDHPISQGYSCPKGRSLPRLHAHPRRLLQPQLRRDGELVDVTWDELISTLASDLQTIIDQSNPNAVGAYRSTHWGYDGAGLPAAERFFRSIGTRQMYSAMTLDTPSKVFVPDMICGGSSLLPQPDWESSEFLLIVGQNPLVSHGHASALPSPGRALRAIRSRGKVVVVDPRTTETARIADEHLKVRPGTDAAMLGFLLHEIFERGAVDQDYLDAYVLPSSVEALRQAVAPLTRDLAASVCDVPAEALERVADLVVTAPRLSVITGTGVSMSTAPNVVEWFAWALFIVTGSMDRPGGMRFNPGMLHPQEGGVRRRPRHTGPPPASRPALEHSYGEYPCVALPDEIRAGEVRALFVLGGNPAMVFPDSSGLREALSSLDQLIVCDVIPTETVALATAVVPVAGILERADLPTYAETMYPAAFTHYGHRVVKPQGNRRPMWWFFAALSQAMGLNVPTEVQAAMEVVGSEEADDLVLQRAIRGGRVTWDEVRRSPHGVVADAAPGIGWLVPDALPVEKMDVCPTELVPQLEKFLGEVGVTRGLRFIGRRLPIAINTLLRDVPVAGADATPALLLNPADLAALGVEDGSLVTLRSEFGEVQAIAEASEEIREGVVSLPHGWAQSNVNLLTTGVDQMVDPLTGMPRLMGFEVQVEKTTAPSP
jgi:anaerobic selenocysteine-containing dehydrogenase